MIYCAACGDPIEGEGLEARHGVGLEEYHAECCPECSPTTDRV